MKTRITSCFSTGNIPRGRKSVFHKMCVKYENSREVTIPECGNKVSLNQNYCLTKKDFPIVFFLQIKNLFWKMLLREKR